MGFTYRQGRLINDIHRDNFFNALNDLKLSYLASKMFKVSTTAHEKKILRARTLQSIVTRVYGCPRVILLVLKIVRRLG